ncbi:MAG: hypothetical protein CMJ32_09470 [Phycisphaerae bacterium]|nr:hypothetical protein [Phycisphaerae bacterium]
MSTSKTIRIQCPNLDCRKVLGVSSASRGKMVRCRSCSRTIKVPAASIAARIGKICKLGRAA